MSSLRVSRGPLNEFVLERLGEGRTLGRKAHAELQTRADEPWCLVLAVADAAKSSHPHELAARGGARAVGALADTAGAGYYRLQMARLVAALGRRGLALVIESYFPPGFWRPEDGRFRELTYENEVCWAVHPTDEALARHALGLVDDWFYKAFLVDASTVPTGPVLSLADLDAIVKATRAVLVTAFDGEAHMLTMGLELWDEMGWGLTN